MNSMIHTSDNLFCLNSSPILELSVKFASQICYKHINKPLDGTYLADFDIDIRGTHRLVMPLMALGQQFSPPASLDFRSETRFQSLGSVATFRWRRVSM